MTFLFCPSFHPSYIFSSGIDIHTEMSSSLRSSNCSRLNRDAKEFVPGGGDNGKVILRPDAPEFVPGGLQTSTPAAPTTAEDLIHLISLSTVKGIRIRDIPKKFQETFNRKMDMSRISACDLSVWIRQLCSQSDSGIQLLSHERAIREPASITDAMRSAGFNVVVEDVTEESTTSLDTDIAVGDSGDFVVRSVMYENFVEDLKTFKRSIVDVVGNFCSRCEAPSTAGLALSLFAAEWDRFHTVRHIFSDFKGMRERFGAVKLMPFLQAIPELEVVGTHPEVRVRIRPGHTWDNSRIVPSPRTRPMAPTPISTPPMTPTISLNSELFGSRTSSTLLSSPVAPVSPEAQTRVILEQMMNQTQGQILDILKKVPSDPIEAANAITKINELQVLVNAIKAALAVLPVPSAPPTPRTVSGVSRASLNRTTLSIDSLLNQSSLEKKTSPIPSSSQKRQLLSLDSMLDLPPIDESGPIVSPPSSPLTAAAGAGNNVGTLLSDLSRILFAQVIQQQQPGVPRSAVEETNFALEKTLNEIVSAASSPPSSPMNTSGVKNLENSDLIGQGQLIIPKSLPTSPILGLNSLMKEATGHSTPLLGGSLNSSREMLSLSSALGISDDAPTTAATTPNDTTMDTLLRGLMNHQMSPPGLDSGSLSGVSSRFTRKNLTAAAHPVDTSTVLKSVEEKGVIGKTRMLALLKCMIGNKSLDTVPKELAGLSCKQAPPRVNRRTPAELREEKVVTEVVEV